MSEIDRKRQKQLRDFAALCERVGFGTTNKQNVRLETNATFAVERAWAALRIN